PRVGRWILVDLDAVAAGGARGARQQASDLPPDRLAVDAAPAVLEPVRQLRESLLDPRREAGVHGLFLLAPLRRAAQQERLVPLRSGAQPGFDPLTHRVPVSGLRELAAPALDLATRRPDQVTPAGLPEPRQVLGAGHAAIHHPDSLRTPVTRLHRPHDLLLRSNVDSISGLIFLDVRHPLATHH